MDVLPEICPGLHHLWKLKPCPTRVPLVLESVNVSRGCTLIEISSFIYSFSKSVFVCATFLCTVQIDSQLASAGSVLMLKGESQKNFGHVS